MKTRLLVVDDDAAIRDSLAERFERDYDVRTADSGATQSVVLAPACS